MGWRGWVGLGWDGSGWVVPDVGEAFSYVPAGSNGWDGWLGREGMGWDGSSGTPGIGSIGKYFCRVAKVGSGKFWVSVPTYLYSLCITYEV